MLFFQVLILYPASFVDNVQYNMAEEGIQRRIH